MCSLEIEGPPAKAWWCLEDLGPKCVVWKLKDHRLKPGGVLRATVYSVRMQSSVAGNAFSSRLRLTQQTIVYMPGACSKSLTGARNLPLDSTSMTPGTLSG